MMVKIAGKHVLLIGIRDLEIHNVTEFMEKLRSINKNVAVQAVNSDLIAGTEHVLGILQQSMEARKRNILLSKRIEVDILLRLACTDQIERALDRIGLREGKNNVLVIAIGKLNHLMTLRKYLTTNYSINDSVLTPSKRKIKIISEIHGISKTELGMVNGKNKLASILVEHASLL